MIFRRFYRYNSVGASIARLFRLGNIKVVRAPSVNLRLPPPSAVASLLKEALRCGTFGAVSYPNSPQQKKNGTNRSFNIPLSDINSDKNILFVAFAFFVKEFEFLYHKELTCAEKLRENDM